MENFGVRAQPFVMRPAAGDPTVYSPPFPLTSFYLRTSCRSAGAGTPRDFMAPNTCDERSYLRRSPDT
jgi:hypothetical protein